VRGVPGSESFVLLYLDGDVVKAALGPNCAKDLRFARRLIEQRKPIDPQRLGDVAVPMSKF
jgi:3-phenylpropionate/trans-cinnamate dioxygenase ferredoxin reductase subunit